MGIRETVDEMDTPELVALAAGLAVVGLIAVVVLAAVLGTFVLSLGEDVQNNVSAAATVQGDEATGELTVTWRSNQNADHLLVTWTAEPGGVEVVEASDGASVEDGAVELRRIGQTVTLSDGDDETATTVRVTVTAVGDGDRTKIVVKEVTV